MQPEVFFSLVAMSLFTLLGAFLTLGNTARQKGFLWLGVLFILLGINALDAALQFTGTQKQYSFLILWEEPSALLFGPVIYFFVENIRTQCLWKRSNWLHLIPYFISLCLVMWFHIINDQAQKLRLLNIMVNKHLSIQVMLFFLPVFAHLAVYLIFSFKIMRVLRKDMKQFYSNFTLNWTSQVLKLLIVIFAISFLSTFIRLSSSTVLQTTALLCVLISSILLMSKVLLTALNQPVFQPEELKDRVFTLDRGESDAIIEQLDQYMSHSEIYQKAEITLKDVAKALDISPRSVSYVLNHSLGKNFYDYINDFRIEAAKEMLAIDKPQKLTILEVMYQVGFNSKSSFNTQFKKKTGLTPSAFRRQLNQSLLS